MPRGIPKIRKEKKTKEPAGEPKEPTIITDADEEFGAPAGHEDPIGLDEGVERAPIFKMLLNPLFLMVILCAAIMYLMITQFTVSDSRYVRDITRLELDLVDDRAALATAGDTINGKIIDLTSAHQTTQNSLNNLQESALTQDDMSPYATTDSLTAYATNAKLSDYATKANLDSYATNNVLNLFSDDMDERLISFGESAVGLSDRITKSAEDIGAVNTELDVLDNSISAVDVKAILLTDKVDELGIAIGNITLSNHLWYTMTGDDGEYVLDVGSSEGGTFMGRITLLYDPPVTLTGNITSYCDALACFYDKLNSPSRRYSPTTAWNGTTWELVQVEVYTSAFTLGAESESSFVIALNGLGTLPMHKAFIEVLEGASAAEGGGGSI